jgi:hypothetical protein
MRPSRESLIVATLCLADLVSTILFVRNHGAAEGNAVMAFYLQHGLAAFVGAKCLLFVPALLIAEWYRRRNPRLVLGTLRLVIVLYVGFYSLGVAAMNREDALGTALHERSWFAPATHAP